MYLAFKILHDSIRNYKTFVGELFLRTNYKQNIHETLHLFVVYVHRQSWIQKHCTVLKYKYKYYKFFQIQIQL